MRIDRRFAALLMCAVLILSLFSSLGFIFHEAGHECIGDGCAVCENMAMLRTLLRDLCALGLLLAAAFFIRFRIALGHGPCVRREGFFLTPVRCRVRMNN